MNLNELTVLTHTHTDCHVLWEPYFESYDRFFSHKNHIVLINKPTTSILHKQYIYSENEMYSNRILECLKSIDTKFVLISFEDMILYDNVKIEELDILINLMNNEEEIIFTRLIKSGIKSNTSYKKNLFLMDKKDFLFSITPTIWRKTELISLLSELKNLNIWNLEISGDELLKNKSFKSLYYYNNEPPRGGHYDSSIYPHICSAIVKGRWNMSEYSDVLLPIIKKYKINIYEKGIF
jgi:hypothetical protein